MLPQTRRTHTKSRAGCLECKRRRRKCNEEKPICSGCTNRSIQCEFPSPVSTPPAGELLRHVHTSTKTLPLNLSVASSTGIPTVGIASRVATSGTPAPSPYAESGPSAVTKTLGHFDTEDMILWHQFLTETAATMTDPWADELPTLASSCDYLMHGILFTAALHLSYLNPGQREKYEYLSTQHQNLAIGPFLRAMSSITSENCNQVFAFSVLIIIAQFAPSRSPNVMHPHPNVTLYKGPANWIVCLRGCASIFKQAPSHINSGPLGRLIAQGSRIEAVAAEAGPLPQNEDERSLEYLSRQLLNIRSIKNSTTMAEMEAYTESISSLRKLFKASSVAGDSLSSRVFSSLWPTQISDTFIRLLHEERPPALIITAHYCLLLKRCHSCWYVEHRAYDLFRAVQQSLAEEWSPYLVYPLRVVREC